MANSKDKHPLTLPPAPAFGALLDNDASSSQIPSTRDPILKALLESARKNASSSEVPSTHDPIVKALLDGALKTASSSEVPSSPDPILKALLDDARKNASTLEGPSSPDPILKALLDGARKNASTSEGPSSHDPILKALLDGALKNASTSEGPSCPDPILKALLDGALKNASTSEGTSSPDPILKALLDGTLKNASSSESPSPPNPILKERFDKALKNTSSSKSPSSPDPILKALLDKALKRTSSSESPSCSDPILKALLDSAHLKAILASAHLKALLDNASSSKDHSTPDPIFKALLDNALKNASSSEGSSSLDPILKALFDRALQNASSSEGSSSLDPFLKAILDGVRNNGSTSSPPVPSPTNSNTTPIPSPTNNNTTPIPSPTNSNTTEQENEINIEDLLNPDWKCYRDLYLAALEGNWEAAESFLQGNREAMTALISPFKMTALHVAANEGHSEFVEKLAKEMPAEALEMRDASEATALHHIVVSGSLKATKALIKKNPTLTNILNINGCTPLLTAVGLGSQHKDLVWYLSMVTKDEGPTLPFTGSHGGDLAIMLSVVGFTDILLYLVDRYPSLATSRARLGHSFLHIMALTPESFYSCSMFGFWESCIYKLIPIPKSYGPPLNVRILLKNPQGSHHPLHISCTTAQRADQGLHWLRKLLLRAIKQMTPRFLERLQNDKLKHHCAKELVERFYEKVWLEHDFLLPRLIHERNILCNAAEFGIVEIVRTCLRSRPELAYGNLGEKQNLVSIAIEHRQEKIFTLFCERNQRNTQLFIQTTKAGTMLHLAAKLAPFPQVSSVTGAALQMQRELQWFKAVEKLIHPNLINSKNDDGKSAREVFTEEHKALAEAGEKWMKDTSNSCMIVSTLIATFVFAAAFTVPGGNDGDGIPIFLWTNSFLVFVIADALALFSSITSLLMFFSILTARYAEEDFLEQLPKKLISGLAALFFSIATMMMAFGATLYIVLSKRLNWVTIPIILLASFPVTIFALLQFPLFFQMFRSTFRNNIFRPQSPWR